MSEGKFPPPPSILVLSTFIKSVDKQFQLFVGGLDIFNNSKNMLQIRLEDSPLVSPLQLEQKTSLTMMFFLVEPIDSCTKKHVWQSLMIVDAEDDVGGGVVGGEEVGEIGIFK